MKVKQADDSRTSPLPAWLRTRDTGVVIAVRVQPGARRAAIVGEHGERLKIAVMAPPLEGRANEALVALVGERLGLAASMLKLEAGIASRDKRIFAVTKLPPEELARRLLSRPQNEKGRR